MTFYSSLQQFYDVIVVSASAEFLPEETDLVVLAHPGELNASLRYAIDQHVMNEGNLLAFIDPYFESNPMGLPGVASDATLLADWGIVVDTEQSVLDQQLGLDIRGPQGGVIRHPGILGISANQLITDDITTANLDSINMASAGVISMIEDSSLNMTPLIISSEFASLVESEQLRTQTDPTSLSALIGDSTQEYVLGARFSGVIESAYDGPIEEDGAFVQKAASTNIILIADADLLADRFWVQQSNFFGQTVFTPFADNGDLLINAVDNLAGSNALISVRSRGTYSRPFTRVEALEVAAQAKFREQEEGLQNELMQIEQELAQLQGQQAESASLALSPEQEAAIDAFVDKRIEVRQALREVRFELDRDIDALGSYLKVLNIAVAPVVLTLLLLVLVRLGRMQAKTNDKGELI